MLVVIENVARYCVWYANGGNSYEDYMEKYCKAGQVTDGKWRTHIAC